MFTLNKGDWVWVTRYMFGYTVWSISKAMIDDEPYGMTMDGEYHFYYSEEILGYVDVEEG